MLENKNIRIVIAIIFLIFLTPFNKTYANDNSLTIKISQDIQINSNYKKPKDTFTYIIQGENLAPKPQEGEKINLVGKENRNITINFPNEGHYKYKIYQISEQNSFVTLDKNIYNLEVNVTKSSSGLKIKNYTIYLDNYKVEEVSFKNIYTIQKEEMMKKLDFLPKTGKEKVESLFLILLALIIILILVILLRIKKKNLSS